MDLVIAEKNEAARDIAAAICDLGVKPSEIRLPAQGNGFSAHLHSGVSVGRVQTPTLGLVIGRDMASNHDRERNSTLIAEVFLNDNAEGVKVFTNDYISTLADSDELYARIDELLTRELVSDTLLMVHVGSPSGEPFQMLARSASGSVRPFGKDENGITVAPGDFYLPIGTPIQDMETGETLVKAGEPKNSALVSDNPEAISGEAIEPIYVKFFDDEESPEPSMTGYVFKYAKTGGLVMFYDVATSIYITVRVALAAERIGLSRKEAETKQDSESKKEAIEAAKLDRNAANIYYENITGFETGYSEACSKLNEMLLEELNKEEVKKTIEYTPKGWGATMRVTLPRNEVEAWKEAGGTPIQAQHLRAVIYELLKNEQEPEWWKKQKTVTLTLGQIVKGMYPGADKKPSDSEINLIARTVEMFIKSDLDSVYPEPTSKNNKAQTIDRDILSIKGYRILPAVMVGETNARGHIVKAAYEFYALPPLEHQSSGIHHSLTIPVLGGLLRDGKKANVTRQAYDLATALGRYVRIAKDKGSCSVNYETIMSDIQPEKYEQMKTRLEAAIYTGNNEEKKNAQSALRMFKRRTKKSIDSVMPTLIDREANREEKPCYLSVHETKKADGLTITVAKQTKAERAKHQKPRLCGYKVKA